MGRSPCCDKAKVKKGPWSAEEDAMLIDYVAIYGNGGNWISLPKKVGLNRCGKSCRLRWLNYLRPDIRHGDFTDDEDYIIHTLYNTIGSRWSVIASNLPGRTDNDVKNYWNTKLKRKIASGKFNNHIPIISKTNIHNAGVSYNTNTESSIQSWQTLGNENVLTSELDRSHQFHVGQGDNYFCTRLGSENHAQSFTTSSSEVTSEISSYPGSSSSSSVDFNQNSLGSITFCGEEDEFWMDLLSDSFDGVVVGSQLEEKISEIASLLDDDSLC